MSLSRLRAEWFGNIRGDILGGTVVALALIPEAIAFSIIAGVDPRVGLYASFCIAVVISFVGGRPAMISAATGAMSLVMVTLVRDHGLQYLLAASVLAGVFQVAAGVLKLGVLMRYVSGSVVSGFLNALAIMIFMAQLPELTCVTPISYVMVAAGLAIIYLFPRLTRAVPSPLVAIVVLTAISIALGLDVRTVADRGALPTELPHFLIPDVPLTFETLRIILPYSVTLAVVGLLESLMTAQVLDEMTETTSNKSRECVGQGVANIITPFLGGMAGCAMIGQSVINVRSGGRRRLSTFWAGVFLLFLILALSDLVKQIPMPALVSVMIMVAITTFSWPSVRQLLAHPRSSSLVMLATVVVTLVSHDLVTGVLTGVLASGISFARKVARLFAVDSALEGTTRRYRVSGQLFFATAPAFAEAFDLSEPVERVVIDVSDAHVWDLTAVAALDRVVLRFRRQGRQVEVTGLNAASETLVDRLGRFRRLPQS
ncbi:SulP family inorganic anion transporter [Rhodovarius lipocyclicus]|uniref:SulP family inorganic anion transporter n=1 Tax=Rhodovarius lipocyclicus TaxID=268410 RepID=UPI00135BACC1|nr:SulP family inorganic anion transporter [Rhodovarius lipocyclicus]